MSKILIIDPTYGEFWQKPNNHLGGQGHPKRNNNNISPKSLTWLLSIDPHQKFVTPYEEVTLKLSTGKKFRPDAYDVSTNTVYEFHGSYWHGWNGKDILDDERYQNTLSRGQSIIDSGYNLVVMWEHDWNPTQADWKRIRKFRR